MASPYATDEDPGVLWYERSNYIATHIAAMGYGLQIAIFAISTYYIIQKRMHNERWIVWLMLNFTLFLVGTINIACSINFNQAAWIDERNYPGGPFRFLMEQQIRPVMTIGNTASIIASFLADGLLLYRVMVLWNYTWYIIVAPTLFYIACVVLSILTVIQIAIPGFGNIINLAFPVWLVLMIITILLSAMIACRILLARRRIKAALGDEYGKPYTSVVSLVIETALPFTILSIVLLVLFGGQITAQNLFVPLLVQVECIAPQLIILRVIFGHGWTHDPTTQKATQPLKFADMAPRAMSPLGIESIRTRMHMNGNAFESDTDTVLVSHDSKPATDTSASIRIVA